jgi:hypothetical protein
LKSSGLIHCIVPPIANELETVEFIGSETMARNPKSARRARPFGSTRILALIKRSKLGARIVTGVSRNAYPLQISMHHVLVVHIYQPPGDVFELREEITECVTVVGSMPYKLEPIGILVGLDELVDVSICHPFGHHHKLFAVHRHT